jgi:hypothetical protein
VSIADAAKRVASATRKGDSVRIATFARKILISETRLFDDATASKAAREVSQQGGPSPLWDALHSSLTAVAPDSGFEPRPSSQMGWPRATTRGSARLKKWQHASGVIVSVVGVGITHSGQWNARIGRNDAIRRLAEGTGGNYVELQRNTDTPIYPLAGIVEQMRKRYRLDFVPPCAMALCIESR